MRNMLRAILAVFVLGMVLVVATPRQADAHLRRYWAGYGGWYGPPAAYRVWFPRRFVYRAMRRITPIRRSMLTRTTYFGPSYGY